MDLVLFVQEKALLAGMLSRISFAINSSESLLIDVCRHAKVVDRISTNMVPRSEVEHMINEIRHIWVVADAGGLEESTLSTSDSKEKQVIEGLNRLLTNQQEECKVLRAQLQVIL